MSAKVDALFAGEPPPSEAELGTRIRRLRWTLALAAPMVVLGLVLWTTVPGALLALWAWVRLEDEVAAVAEGRVTGEEAQALRRLHGVARWLLVFCVGWLVLQGWLLSTSFYETVWGVLVLLWGLAAA